MANKPRKTYAVRLASPSDLDDLVTFHEQNLTEYLWPRTIKDFEALINERQLYEIVEHTPFHEFRVGLCYIRFDLEDDGRTERHEFGGVFLLPEHRGNGLAYWLGLLALAGHFVQLQPTCRMIAHVHELNDAPRSLLQNGLGFVHVGEDVVPSAPSSIKRNADGKIVGHLFEFQRETLRKFAQSLRSFSGCIKEGEKFDVHLEISSLYIAKILSGAIQALEDLADSPPPT